MLLKQSIRKIFLPLKVLWNIFEEELIVLIVKATHLLLSFSLPLFQLFPFFLNSPTLAFDSPTKHLLFLEVEFSSDPTLGLSRRGSEKR